MISLKILFLFVLINVFGGVRTQTTEITHNHRKYVPIVDILNYTHPDQEKTWMNAENVYAFTVKDINGKNVPMSKYKGKVLIIVNLASKCGITNASYHRLNEIYDKYSSKGLVVLGFPSNQFHQEPGNNADISKFAADRNVKFPMFAKIEVNGDDASPLWKYMKSRANLMGMTKVNWNFTKFIVNREGKVMKRISPLNPMYAELEEYF